MHLYLCTAPPPALFHCGVSVSQTYAHSVRVQWQSPSHCGGRKDCYYEIAVNGQATVRYDPTAFNVDVLESYTINNLQPSTTYLVSVSIHNGVSDQDPDSAKLRQCFIEVKTKEGSKFENNYEVTDFITVTLNCRCPYIWRNNLPQQNFHHDRGDRRE